MKNNKKSLKKLLEILLEIKAAKRITAEPRFSELLNEAISEIEHLIKNDEIHEKERADRALQCLGWLLKSLPSIVDLIKQFFS